MECGPEQAVVFAFLLSGSDFSWAMCQHYKENWTVLKVQRSLKAVHIGLMQLVM